jgi:ribosomal protein L37AE/L43A
MSFGAEVKHCEKCGKLIVREDTQMQWFCSKCRIKE